MTCEITFFGQLVLQHVCSGMGRAWLSNDPQPWAGLRPRVGADMPLVCWPVIQLVFVQPERETSSLALDFLAVDYKTVILVLYIDF